MIDITHPNGFRGILEKDGEFTVYKDGELVMQTCRARLTTEEDVRRELAEMPRFIEMVRVIHD